MKRLAIVMTLVVATTSVLLSGCEPFPDDAPKTSGNNTPTKTVAEAKAPAVNTPTATSGSQKPSDATPVQSTTSSASTDSAPTSAEAQSTVSTDNKPEVKPEEPEPVSVAEPEDDEPKMVPNAGKLQIIGTSGKDVYYMKKVEQPDANCYVVSNSVTWDTSVSCVPAVNVHLKKEETPPVTNVTSGK